LVGCALARVAIQGKKKKKETKRKENKKKEGMELDGLMDWGAKDDRGAI